MKGDGAGGIGPDPYRSPAPTAFRLESRIGTLLRVGLVLSMGLLLAGLLLSLLGGDGSLGLLTPGTLPPVGPLPAWSVGLLFAGVVLLVVTPILRVALAVTSFGLERDWSYVLVTALVLLLLLSAGVVGAYR